MRGSWTHPALCRPQGRGARQRRPSSSRISSPSGSPSTSARRDAPVRTGEVDRRSTSPPNISTAPPRPASASKPMPCCARRRRSTTIPGYTFGRLDDTIETDREPLGVVGTTDDDGNATAEVTLPEPAARPRGRSRRRSSCASSTPMAARSSAASPGRCWPTVDRIGIKPLFGDGRRPRRGQRAPASTSSPSRPTAKLVAKTGLNWTLSRIETNYQWYRDDGTWKWEAVTTTRQVANGTRRHHGQRPGHGLGAGRLGPATVLEVESTGDDADLVELRVLCRLLLCRGRLGHARHAAGRARQAGLHDRRHRQSEARSAVCRHRAGDGGRRPHHRHAGGRRAGRRHHRRPAGHRRLGPGRLCDGDALSSRRAPPKSGCRRARSASPSPMSIRAIASSMCALDAPKEALPRAAVHHQGQARQRRGRARRPMWPSPRSISAFSTSPTSRCPIPMAGISASASSASSSAISTAS